ncbi:MAG: diguanylate cyclase [Clostridiales bacterium]|nr:diguanylate cyclase [Clostridiales bacterium]
MSQLGFSKQILLLLLSLVIICTVVTGVISYNVTYELNDELVMENLEAITESTYNLIDSAVNVSIRNHLRAIAEINKDIIQLYYDKYQRGELTEIEAKTIINEILMSQKIGDSGYTYLLDSKGVLSHHPVVSGEDISSYDFVKNQIETKEGYLTYLWKNPEDVDTREKVLYMTYFEPWDYIISVSSYKSEFINLINVFDFKENILSAKTGETGYMYVMNSKGELVIHPKQEGISIYDSVDAEGHYFIREIIKNKNGSIVYPWKNPDEEYYRDKIVMYRYYEPMDWYLCSGVYIEEINEPVKRMKNRLLLAFFFIILLSTIIALIYSRIIISPIKNLINVMKNVNKGEYDIAIENKRHDEIGELTNIFSKMIYQIKNYMEELKISNVQLSDTNKMLEEKVKERTHELELLSNLDALTGLYNRRKLDEFLNISWQEAIHFQEPIALLMIDIDYFKVYNDTYGHPAGDECLKRVAQTIKKMFRKQDDFVARYGGEEFLVILKNADDVMAESLGNRVRNAVEQLNIVNSSSDISDYITISIGIAILKNHEEKELIEFVKSSDRALYEAKAKGRNQVSLNYY